MRAIRPDNDLLLQLHPFPPALRADVTLDAQRHAFFDDSVVPARFPVQRMDDVRIFVRQPYAVTDTDISSLDEFVRGLPAFLRQLLESGAGPKNPQIVLELFMRQRIQAPLLIGGFARAAQESS